MGIPGLSLAGGQGGVNLSSGPAKSSADGRSTTGGATFYFSPPPSTQTAMAQGNLVWPIGLAVVAVAWLALRKK